MRVRRHPRFDRVYVIRDGRSQLATLNLVPGFRSYDEVVRRVSGREYRIWSPHRSKPAAAILRGIRTLPVSRGTKILYLGIASGTTASHFSDMVGWEGVIYGVEVAHRPMRDLLRVARVRKNIVPILGSARRPESYAHLVEEVDVLYADVAQPDQGRIVVENSEFYLKDGGHVILAVKASSVDVRLPPKEVYEGIREELRRGGLRPLELIDLGPFYPKHAIIAAKRS